MTKLEQLFLTIIIFNLLLTMVLTYYTIYSHNILKIFMEEHDDQRETPSDPSPQDREMEMLYYDILGGKYGRD